MTLSKHFRPSALLLLLFLSACPVVSPELVEQKIGMV